MSKYDKYIHTYKNANDEMRYVVAQYTRYGTYIQPMDKAEQKLTGGSAYYGPLSYLTSYPTRRQALRRARYLFGPESEGDSND